MFFCFRTKTQTFSAQQPQLTLFNRLARHPLDYCTVLYVSMHDNPSGVNASVASVPNEATCKARAFLRERFIRAVLAMNGKMADFHMYDNTDVSAAIGSCDREFVNIHVKSLMTPLGTISDALLRTNDIESISICDINPSNCT